MARARCTDRRREDEPSRRKPDKEEHSDDNIAEALENGEEAFENDHESNKKGIKEKDDVPASSSFKKKKVKRNKRKKKREADEVKDPENCCLSDDEANESQNLNMEFETVQNGKAAKMNGHFDEEVPEIGRADDLMSGGENELSNQEKTKKKKKKKRKRKVQENEDATDADKQTSSKVLETDSPPMKRKRQDSESVIDAVKDQSKTENIEETREDEKKIKSEVPDIQTEPISHPMSSPDYVLPSRSYDFFNTLAYSSSDNASYDSDNDGLGLLTGSYPSFSFNDNSILNDEFDDDGFEQAFSREEPNSDQEIDNVISTIRPKSGHTFDGDKKTENADQSRDSGDDLMFPLDDNSNPFDDEVILSDGQSDGLYEDEGDSEEDLDISDDADEDAEPEPERPESSISTSLSSSSASSYGPIEFHNSSDDATEQYRTRDVLNCSIEGYQTVKDGNLLLSLCRKTAPKSRMGSFKTFKFTEKKLIEGHSVEIAEDAFCWMIAPLELNYFYKLIYERIVLHVSRRDCNFFKGILTCDNLLQISQNFNLKYGENLNVVKYSDPLAKVEYFNPETDKVYSKQLKTLFENGKSIEFRNPQIFSDEIWYLCEILQELTNTVVGSKIYLTGKESSAFPPHCDDFNNIVLQLEGKQIWRIWAPKYLNSTEEFKEFVTPTLDDLKKMRLVFDDTLDEGDTIYIPKGFYYEAYTGNQHSLHLNIEWSKNMTFIEMMKSISTSIWDQIEKNEPLSKRSLPLNVLLMGGEACIDYDHPSPDNDYKFAVTKLWGHAEKYYDESIPVALDNFARSYLRTALPPMLTDSERRQSIHGHSSLMIGDANLKFTNETKVKLIRMHTQRLLYDKEKNPSLAHRINNSRNIEENIELKTIGIEKDMLKGVVALFDQYPKWTKIAKLHCTEEINMELAKLLYNNGLLMAS